MKYYIADTHFNHENIIKYCNRPFMSVDRMNECIIERWNKKVKAGDDVYILGDFCMGNQEEVDKFLRRLNGNKYLILGNHDRVTNDNRGFVWVKNIADIKDNGRHVILFHYPIESWNGKFHGAYHLYGHIHNSEIVQKIENRFNAGVDVNDFEPKTLDELILLDHE